MNTVQSRQAFSGKWLAMILADSFLNYLRWTQFIQFLSAFGIALLMVALLTVISFQEQSTNVIKTAMSWIVELPWVGEYLKNAISEDSGTRLSGADLKSYLITAWATLSLVGFVLDSLWHRTGRVERKPWSLKRKLGLVLLGCILLLGIALADFFTHREMFKGDNGVWMVTFGWLTFFLFIVSVWNIVLIHGLDWLRAELPQLIAIKD